MFNFSQSLFVLSFLLHLMPSVTVGVSIGGHMGIEDSHIKKGTFKPSTPKAISCNIQSCTILSVR